MDDFTIDKTIMKQNVRISVNKLGHGISINIFGGELSHIGAVTIADEEGNILTTTLPEHKEYVICEEWAKEIYKIKGEPVSVLAGIHYDNLTPKELKYLVNELRVLKQEVLKNL